MENFRQIFEGTSVQMRPLKILIDFYGRDKGITSKDFKYKKIKGMVNNKIVNDIGLDYTGSAKLDMKDFEKSMNYYYDIEQTSGSTFLVSQNDDKFEIQSVKSNIRNGAFE